MATATRKRATVADLGGGGTEGAPADAPHGGSPRLGTLRTASTALRVCGFALERRDLGLVMAVLTLHTAVTVYEEMLFSTPGFHHGMFLSFTTMLLMAAIFGLYMSAELLFAGRSPLAAASAECHRLAASRGATHGLAVVFGCYTLSTSLSKVSLAYISVPLQVVVKSSKIIPVMIGGRFITGKRYSYSDYAGACLLAAGVALFSGAGGNVSAAAAAAGTSAADALAIGLGLLAITLCADALLGNWQERTMHEAAIAPSHMMLLQSLFAALLSGAAALVTGELGEGMALLRGAGGAHLAFLLLCYSAVMLLGTTAILTLVETHGAAAAVLVTLVRKCSSMFFSFLLWPKPLSGRHVLGAAMVFAAPFAAQRGAKTAKGSSGTPRADAPTEEAARLHSGKHAEAAPHQERV